MPWTTPGAPRPTAAPPDGSAPTRRASVSTKPENNPAAFEPPPTQATTTSGIAAGERPALLAGLVADHPVQLAHHPRVRVRAHHRAEAVVGVADGGDPVPQRLVDGVLERAAAAVHGLDLGAEHPHPEHVERLTVDVDGAHVHLALESEQRGRGGGGDAVLAGAGLGDEPGLAHPLGQQGLAEHVVDLVGAGVVEVLALEQHAHTELVAEVVALGEDRRPAGVVAQHVVELRAERRIGPRVAERASSSWHAGTSVSGTKRPPNSPKRPVASGSPISPLGAASIAHSSLQS